MAGANRENTRIVSDAIFDHSRQNLPRIKVGGADTWRIARRQLLAQMDKRKLKPETIRACTDPATKRDMDAKLFAFIVTEANLQSDLFLIINKDNAAMSGLKAWDNLESHFISKNNRGAVALIKTFSTLISKRGILARQRQGKPAFKLLYLQAEAVVEELLTYVDSNNAVKEIASLIILAKLDNIESYSSSWELKTILAGNRKNLHLDAEELSNVAPNVKDHPYSQIVREPVQQSAMMTQGPLNQQNNSGAIANARTGAPLYAKGVAKMDTMVTNAEPIQTHNRANSIHTHMLINHIDNAHTRLNDLPLQQTTEMQIQLYVTM
eukprot:CAMPEP_0171484682 /NCGR_PEP_ID=MMETSP0958-20121227/136_1 /TAXON_ID=87120 /ORGANISM="Aurantiochytrium limacinum, Strain ATCCMYA-1381" /LENGTH=322 /DNA_ID=CAMNT_0012017409 /DNA_START=201 /DNA_END=1170 /DNA_ORIENTATION=-